MRPWKKIKDTWCLWPSRPKALIELIGGGYLSISPNISYKVLLEALLERDLAIHAWGYVPGLDHQLQANDAWRNLRSCKKLLENRIGKSISVIRVGHSLGCKLHLLAPDGGRNSKGLITLCFNNFTAQRSIPMLRRIQKTAHLTTEFSPSPKETLRLINKQYVQSKNLIISFGEDKLDQSTSLIECLRERPLDETTRLHLNGDHLTPASAGLRKHIIGKYIDLNTRNSNLNRLVEEILDYSKSLL